MDMMGRIKRVLEGHPEVAFAYLFGSWAKGRQGPTSDIDVAVWFHESVHDRLKAQLKLMGELGAALGTDHLDLVVLNDATLSLRYIVQRDGILACERDRCARIAFEARTRREYWDFEPLLKVYRDLMRRRMEAGRYGTGLDRKVRKVRKGVAKAG